MAIEEKYSYPEQSIASYDWSDIQSGFGYRIFYLGASTNSGGTSYFVSQKVQDSFPPYYNATGTPVDTDFDLSFFKQEIVQGKAIFNFTQKAGSSGASGSATTRINIYHVDKDGNETLLGYAITSTRSGAGVYYRENLQITIAKIKFSEDEKLRINIIHTGSANLSTLYFDPSSSLSFTDTYTRSVGSDFIGQIPFKIDL